MFQVIGHSTVQNLYVFNDTATQLHGYIAIHSTKLGPALGGTRCVRYESDMSAVNDAIKLAKGMTYKAAMANIPCGGGKAVLIKPDKIHDRKSYFCKFGEYVERLNGQFITSIDSGTTPRDIEFMAETTQYITKTNSKMGNPSPFTAKGVLEAMKAAVWHVFNQRHLNGLRIAVQGVGNVGSELAHLLHKEGASLILTDENSEKCKQLCDEVSAQFVTADQIYQQECDIFSPCALGGALDIRSIHQLSCKVVVGAANNQLETEDIPTLLHARNITYVPDYVANSGGLIAVSEFDKDSSADLITEKVSNIFGRVTEILQEAKEKSLSPALIADAKAEAVLDKARYRGVSYGL